jgi:hypothetical protein
MTYWLSFFVTTNSVAAGCVWSGMVAVQSSANDQNEPNGHQITVDNEKIHSDNLFYVFSRWSSTAEESLARRAFMTGIELSQMKRQWEEVERGEKAGETMHGAIYFSGYVIGIADME